MTLLLLLLLATLCTSPGASSTSSSGIDGWQDRLRHVVSISSHPLSEQPLARAALSNWNYTLPLYALRKGGRYAGTNHRLRRVLKDAAHGRPLKIGFVGGWPQHYVHSRLHAWVATLMPQHWQAVVDHAHRHCAHRRIPSSPAPLPTCTGGSITFGDHSSKHGETDWAALVVKWSQSVFPNVTSRNGAVPATPSVGLGQGGRAWVVVLSQRNLPKWRSERRFGIVRSRIAGRLWTALAVRWAQSVVPSTAAHLQ